MANAPQVRGERPPVRRHVAVYISHIIGYEHSVPNVLAHPHFENYSTALQSTQYFEIYDIVKPTVRCTIHRRSSR